jgi:hypothetical protein
VVEPVQPRLRLILEPSVARAGAGDVRGGAWRPYVESATRCAPAHPRRARRRLWLTSAMLLTFALALFVAELKLDPAGTTAPTAAVTAREPSPPADLERAPTQATRPASVRPAPTGDPGGGDTGGKTPQRLAWAPVARSSGYHVELFRGNSLVFATDTRSPTVTIPAKWSFDRREHVFEPVAYRWYVWPIVSGKRTTRAVVQARLVVRDR